MTKKELIELLRKILKARELAEDLKKKLQELVDALERNEPTAIIIARLLADLIELGTDPLPGPISDFIKAYAEAFKNAINQILGILWWKYRKMRENGLTHQEANALVSSDPQICEWLHFGWAYEHMKVEPPPAGGTPPPKPMLPVPPTSGPPPVPWEAADDNCCRNNNVPPTVTVKSATVYKDSGSWYLDATIEVTHPCRILYGPDTKVYAVIAAGAAAIKLEIREPQATDIPNGKSITWDKVQVSATRPRSLRIHVRAVSRCATVFDGLVPVP